VPAVLDRLRDEGVDPDRVPVVVGGVIPDEDAAKLKELGASRVYTPRDYDLTAMMGDIAGLVGERGD
jgi:(2R)-ethylmalonyl-CoA mutase